MPNETAKTTVPKTSQNPEGISVREHLNRRVLKDGSISKMKRNTRGPGGAFGKGNSGRPKGSKNKHPSLRTSFMDAFDEIGGTKELADWAIWINKAGQRVNQAKFYAMLSKMLPKEIEVSGPGGGPISNINLTGERLTDEQLESIINGSD